MKNREARLLAPGKVEVFDCEMPELEPGKVLVKMEYCGVCGSDVHFFKDGRIGRTVVNFPFVQGHECSGVVEEVGEGVSGLVKGDRIVMEPGVPCGTCEHCRSGHYNLCEKVVFMATPPYDGAFRKYVAYPAEWCFKLPEKVSTLEAAMIEPLAIGVYSAHVGDVSNEDVVVITGMGCIGLMTLMACKARNVQKIIVSDVFENRLEKALELGADVAINAAKEDVVARVKEETEGKGGSVVFEASGYPASMAQAVYLLKRGGTIVQIGTTAEPVPYQFNELVKIEGTIKAVYRYRNMFPLCIKLIEKGDFDLSKVDPAIFDFEEIAEAFDTAINKGNEVVKCVVKF